MLDLEKLEKKLDEALANETTESLLNWLHKNREIDFGKYLGEGSFEELDSTISKFEVSFDTKSVQNKETSAPNYDFYKFAA